MRRAETNALRRAAQDAWGIGRYLYDKGIPGFLDPHNMPLKKYAEPAVVKPTQEQHKDRTAGETYPSLVNNKAATFAAEEAPHRTVVDIFGTPVAQLPAKEAENARAAVQQEALNRCLSMTPTEIDEAAAIIKAGAKEKSPAPDQNLAKLATRLNKTGSSPKAEPINLPRGGKSTFSWVKLMENTFGERLLPGMIAHAKDLGWTSTVAEWTEAQSRVITLGAAAHIMKLPSYQGQFDHLAAEIKAAQETPKPTPAPTAGINVADFRKELIRKMKALILAQTKRESTDEELKGMFEEVASQCQDSHGHIGEIPENLSHLADVTWLRNMIRFVDDQIAHTMSNESTPEGDDCPF